MEAHIDFETRSPVLIAQGLDLYLREAELLCMGWVLGDDDEPALWTPQEPFPEALREHIASGGTCVAHNAEFEYHVFARLLKPYAPSVQQWWCTATQAAACGLPRNLDDACRKAGVQHRKDPRGEQLIKALCVPPYLIDADMLVELGQYCLQDVRAERALSRVLRKPTPDERRDWEANTVINARGLPVDVRMAAAAQVAATYNRDAAEQKLRAMTHGAVDKAAGAKLLRWVREQTGWTLPTLDKYDRAALLARDDLPAVVREVLLEVDDVAYSSVSKYAAAVKRTAPDGRLRGSYLLNGAGQTGRYSSTGLQVHNLPRLPLDKILLATSHAPGNEDAAVEALCEQIVKRQPVPQEALSYMLRPLIRAPQGRALVWGDWAAIEGRVLPWLADTDAADDKLDLYWDGEDVYVHTAAVLYGCTPQEVTPRQRQEGKVAELALGYGGGQGALLNMARAYGMTFDDDHARRIVDQWRTGNAWATAYWDTVERAFMAAYERPNNTYSAGMVSYRHIPETRAVWCLLPSGRLLCYRDVRYTRKPNARRQKWDPPDAGELTADRGYGRVPLWRGLLVENITQAVAADVLRHTVREHYQALPIIGHTHDEIILECGQHDVPAIREQLRVAMTTAPDWAAGLPLKVKIESGTRYSK